MNLVCLLSLDTPDGFLLCREIFNTTNVTNDVDNESVNETCDDYNNACCSRDDCSHSIRDQVKYFINIKNLYR